MPPPLHGPVPPYNSQELSATLESYVRKTGTANAFCFGLYDRVTDKQAVRGEALAANAEFIRSLVSVAPSGRLLYADTKRIVQELALQFPKMQGKQALDMFACDIANRIQVLLAHTRRIHHSRTRLRQAVQDVSDADRRCLNYRLTSPALWHSPYPTTSTTTTSTTTTLVASSLAGLPPPPPSTTTTTTTTTTLHHHRPPHTIQ